MLHAISQLDANTLYWIQNHLRSESVNQFFEWFTAMGERGFIWIVIVFLLFCFRKTEKTGIYCLISLLTDVVIVNLLLKPLVHRVRPFDNLSLLRSLVPYPKDFSFPSGHTAAAFAIVGVLVWRGPFYVSVPVTILACLMGFSRLYVGVHYPTDVIGGALIGFLCGTVVCFIMKKLENRKSAIGMDGKGR